MNHRLSKLLLMVVLTGAIGTGNALEADPAATVLPSNGPPTLPVNPAYGLRSVLEPGNSPDDHFAIIPRPEPTGWALLLGALLTGGFIVRRRLRGD